MMADAPKPSRGPWTLHHQPFDLQSGDGTNDSIFDADDNIVALLVGVSRVDARLMASASGLLAALVKIADESVFNQQRYAEDTDTDYFLRCFKTVKDEARAAIARAERP